jgi:hypothetical protein
MAEELEINIGDAVCRKMEEFGTTTAWLANQVNCDRSNLRKHLQKAHIYPELLFRISITLKTDFFACYSEQIKKTLASQQEK